MCNEEVARRSARFWLLVNPVELMCNDHWPYDEPRTRQFFIYKDDDEDLSFLLD